MNKIYEEINKYFSQDDKLVAGVSGGADSMALLHALLNCGIPLNLHVAHLNHMLRGEESVRDEHFVADYCKEAGVDHSIRRIDIKKLAGNLGISEELCGRQERYRLFSDLAEGGLIVTAHTLSDRIETMLFNMARGTGISGLCSIPARRDNIVRPLLEISREEIEQYCRINNVPFVQDSTNMSDMYSRNKIRHQVIPVLKKINTGFEQNSRRMFENLVNDREYLDSQAKIEYNNSLWRNQLRLETLNRLHPAMSCRVIALFLQDNGIGVDYELIKSALGLCRKPGRHNTNGNKFIVSNGEFLSVENPKEPIKYFEHIINDFQNSTVGGFRFWLGNQEDYKEFIKIKKFFFNFIIDYDKLIGKVKIRQRLAGDQIHLPKRPAKSLKKLFNELKIPLTSREALTVFADSQGVFAVEEVGIDKRVQPDSETSVFLFVEKMKG